MVNRLRGSLNLNLENERYFSLRKRGILFLDDDVGEGSFAKFSRDLIYIATDASVFVDENHKTEKKKIWIILNSPGGDILYGLAIYDCIQMLVSNGVEVNILGMGMVASMAVAVLQAGSKRFALPNTQFLLHQASESVFFKTEEVNEMRERAEELGRINTKMMGIVASRVGMPVDELLKQTHKKDLWLDCERARALGTNGLVDEIITKLPF